MFVYVFKLAEYVISVFPANQGIYKEPLKHQPRIQIRPQGLIFKRVDWRGPWGEGCERHTNRVS